MPSSPKIKKEDMLQAALDIVVEEGYAALNIKAVAKKLGCSTAPILDRSILRNVFVMFAFNS